MGTGSKSRKASTTASKESTISTTASQNERRRRSPSIASAHHQPTVAHQRTAERCRPVVHHYPTEHRHPAEHQHFPTSIEDPLATTGLGIRTNDNVLGYDGVDFIAQQSSMPDWDISLIHDWSHPIQEQDAQPWNLWSPRYYEAEIQGSASSRSAGFVNDFQQPPVGDIIPQGDVEVYGALDYDSVAPWDLTTSPASYPMQTSFDHDGSLYSWNVNTQGSSFTTASSSDAFENEYYDQSPMDDARYWYPTDQSVPNMLPPNTYPPNIVPASTPPSSSPDRAAPRWPIWPTPPSAGSNRSTQSTSYPCRICGLCFTREKDRDRHAKTKHGKDTYECVFCQYRYPRKDKLERHWHKYHQQETYRERYRLVRVVEE